MSEKKRVKNVRERAGCTQTFASVKRANSSIFRFSSCIVS